MSRNNPRTKTTVHWAENLRARDLRWVETGGVDGRRLADLGVPLNAMTPAQRAEAEAVTGLRVALTP